MSSNSFLYSQENTAESHSTFTKREIIGQPELWKEILSDRSWQKSVRQFLLPLLNLDDLQIILTGAGSSAFIGEAVEIYLARIFQKPVRALPTTLLVTHFRDYIDINKPTLFISYARSGNSPESTAVMKLAEQYCASPYHIAVTCNPEGALAIQTKALKNAISVILPKKAEDKALAMTGSFTGMIISSLLIGDSLKTYIKAEHSTALEHCGDSLIDQYSETFQKISKQYFDRIIFLGSGSLKAIAKESHLKVQELTDGQVVGKYDSFLGFRHGPKVVSTPNTIIFCLFSSNDYVFRYEKDLTEDLIENKYAGKVVGVFAREDQTNALSFDGPHEKILLQSANSLVGTGLDILPYVIPAQLIGYYKSVELGLNPDKPSRSGAISRVVQGVKIYNYNS